MNIFKAKGFDAIIVGFVIFYFGGVLRGFFESEIIVAAIKSIGWLYIIKGFLLVKGNGFKTNNLPHSYITLVRFYVFLTIVMIIRGYMIDYPYIWFTTQGMINYHLFQDTYILPYLMPLALFIPWQKIRFDLFVKISMWVGIISIVYLALTYQTLVQQSLLRAYYGREAGEVEYVVLYTVFAFSVFLFSYIPRKVWYYNLFGLVVCALTFIVAGRRGGSLFRVLELFFAIYLFWKSVRGINKPVVTIILVALALGSIYFALHSDSFIYLLDRGMEDTRSDVDEEMLKQMNEWQLLLGKGLNGRYYYPYLVLQNDYLQGWRYGTETGFLNLVLKGGYLYCMVYTLILLIPSIKGIFRSNNILCQAGGAYLMLAILAMYPFGWLTFDIKHFVYWLLISLIMNPTVRNMTDRQIKDQFFPRI